MKNTTTKGIFCSFHPNIPDNLSSPRQPGGFYEEKALLHAFPDKQQTAGLDQQEKPQMLTSKGTAVSVGTAHRQQGSSCAFTLLGPTHSWKASPISASLLQAAAQSMWRQPTLRACFTASFTCSQKHIAHAVTEKGCGTGEKLKNPKRLSEERPPKNHRPA